MSPVNYSQFQLKDFLEDDYFIQWVIHPDSESNSFWESFTASYPQKRDILQKAADTIRLYRKQDFFDNHEHKDLVWQRIVTTLNQTAVVPRKRVFRLPVFMRVAAALVIAAGALFWLSKKNSADKSYSFATTFGEIKTITLPDNSQVILNGNSTLSYKTRSNGTGAREVWINGEGYFNVKHLNRDTSKIIPSERFVVHCEDINIEVLGTTFNVKARHGKTNVALLTGKIRIDFSGGTTYSKAMILAPGDYVEYASKKLLVNKKLAKPAQVTNWTSNEISFTDATLKEITEILKDNYGYTVITKDQDLLSLKIEGDISVSNVTDLLDVVSTTLNITIEQLAGKHLVISK